jgi:hypothetical protein
MLDLDDAESAYGGSVLKIGNFTHPRFSMTSEVMDAIPPPLDTDSRIGKFSRMEDTPRCGVQQAW